MTKEFSWGRGFTSILLPLQPSPRLHPPTVPQVFLGRAEDLSLQGNGCLCLASGSQVSSLDKGREWHQGGDQEAEPGQPAQPCFCSLVPSPQWRIFSSPGDVI